MSNEVQIQLYQQVIVIKTAHLEDSRMDVFLLQMQVVQDLTDKEGAGRYTIQKYKNIKGFTAWEATTEVRVFSHRCLRPGGSDDVMFLGLHDVYPFCPLLHNAALHLRLLHPSLHHHLQLLLHLQSHPTHNAVGACSHAPTHASLNTWVSEAALCKC